MGLVLPVDGGSNNVWDTILDTLFGVVDSHGHVPGQGVPIVSAALNINADVSWAGFAISHLLALYFTEQAAAPTTNDAIFVLSSDHNLYFRNSTGTNVQITAGNTLNISIVGGIGGDYSSVGALLSYDDATRRYLLQQEGSPRPWAGIATADIDLYQKAASIVNKVTLQSPNALAASYTMVMPTGLPAAKSLMYIDNTGQISTSISKTIQIPAAQADLNTANTRIVAASAGMYAISLANNGATSSIATFPIPLNVGDTITAWTVYAKKTSDNTNTMTADLFFQTGGTGTPSQTGATAANSANNPGAITLTTSGLSVAVTAGTFFSIGVQMTAGATAGDLVMLAEVTYTRGS